MFSRLLLFLLSMLTIGSLARAQTAASPNEGLQLIPGSVPESSDLVWWGRAGHTYFVQISTDLFNWHYLPGLIVSGAGQVVTGVIEFFPLTEGPRLFFRLQPTDIPTSDPAYGDFDGDHVNNLDEIDADSDPLHYADTDGDGMSDAWETRYGSDPLYADGAADLDLDGVSNEDEYAAGTDPADNLTVRIVSASEQTAEPDTYCPRPFTAEVRTLAGVPIANAPVRFTVELEGGYGRLSGTTDRNGLARAVTVRTGINGQASAYYLAPATAPSGTFPITAPISTKIGLRAPSTTPFAFQVTTRIRYTYPPGTLGRHASDAIESRLAGRSPATALKIFSTEIHSLTSPVYIRNTQCWAYDLRQQMTCISPWNEYNQVHRAGTAITPQHILFAAHFPIPEGKVRFITADNVVVEETIVGLSPALGDMQVATLSAPLPASITPCKVLPANYATYLSALDKYRPAVLLLDQEEKALTGDLIEIGGGPPQDAIYRPPIFGGRVDFYEPPVQYDSGNPNFLIVNNTLVLLSVFHRPVQGTFTSSNLPALNAMIAAADANADPIDLPGGPTGFTVQTVDLSGFTPFTPP